jgi:hypothetical protein
MEWDLGDVLWTMLALFFWTMAIWVFIAICGDIFRRRDVSGWAKAGWISMLFFLPFLGALIYTVARPRMTAQDREDIVHVEEMQRRLDGYSSADEIAKLASLRDAGELTVDEYEDLKRRALVEV